jgi:putative protein-disulfide isomerase
MQKAFYYDGLSLSNPQTNYKIALQQDLDADEVMKILNDPAEIAEAHAEFAQVHRLGVNSYPTLLLRDGNELISLGATMNIEELEERLASTVIAKQTKGDQCTLGNKEGC